MKTKPFGVFKRILLLGVTMVLLFSLPHIHAHAATHYPMGSDETSGISVNVSDATSDKMSNGVITVTAKGSGGFLGIGASAKTTTITVTNSGTEKATVSFDWTATSVNQLTIDGTVVSGTSGTKSKLMNSGDSFTVVITTAKNSTTNTLVMKNFACTVAKTSSIVTFQYNSNLGSVTANGVAVANGGSAEIALSGDTVVATPVNGATFLGWINVATHERLSTSTTYTLTPADDMTITAAFTNASSAPWFLVNGTDWYDDLNTAASAAGSGGRVVVACNGTLPAGDYTIPSGVTLLIPFDSANTLYTTTPGEATYSTPKVYRTLTMESGSNITVNGAMSVPAKVSYTFGENGATTGDYGCVDMEAGSSISVSSSGALYVYGFITGSGTVDVASNATVYQCFYFKDWRGGSQTTSMKNKVFPMSQYYIQNIEVPLSLHASAKLYGYCYADVSILGATGTAVSIFGANGLFNVTDGYITMRYDGSQDRSIYDIYGTMEMNSTKISISIYSISSASYVFGYNHSTIFNVHSGSTVAINKDAALYPGAKVLIEEGGTFKLGSGVNFYVYDANNWGTYCYNNGPVVFSKATYAPGRVAGVDRTSTLQEDAQIQVNGTFDASAGYLYTTCGTNVDSGSSVSDAEGGGANIFSTGTGTVKINPGTATVTYQCIQGSSTTYDNVPITSAKLKNADGTYIQSGANTYTYTDGYWRCETHTGVDTDHECDVCGFVTECVDTDDHKCDVCGEEGISECMDENSDAVCDICQKILCEHETVTPTEAVAATCEDDGTKAYWTCNTCNNSYADEAYTVLIEDLDAWKVDAGENGGLIPATGHAYAVIENGYIWAQDYSKVTANGVCANDETHTATVDCAKVESATTDPTCSMEGSILYTATFAENSEWTNLETQNEAVELNIDVNAHAWDNDCDTDCNYDATHTREITHKYGEWVVTTHPTCETDGVETKTCSVCGDEQTQPVTKLGHKYGEAEYNWSEDGKSCTAKRTCANDATHVETATAKIGSEITTPATCTVMGTTTYTATFEGVSWATTQTKDVQDVAVIFHTYDQKEIADDYKKSDATCTAAAVYYYSCSCGAKGAETFEHGEANGHTEETIPAVDATCTIAGSTAGVKCSVCGETLTAQEEIPALGHTEETVAGKDATCTETGLTEGKKCSVCGEETVAQEEIPALGHTEETVAGKDATCTETGLTEGKHCSVCKEVLVAQNEVPALGHSYTADVTTEPTCTEKGVKTYTCTCGTSYTEEIEALGHNMVAVEGKAATCTEDGYTAYTDCSRCDHIEGKEVIKAGHTIEQGEAQTKTCTQDGWEAYEYCTECDYSTKVVIPKGHTIAQGEAQTKTCTQDGWAAYEYCTECDYTTKEVIPAGHSFTNYVSAGDLETATCSCGATDTRVVEGATSETDKVVTIEPEENEGEVYTSANVTMDTDLLGDIADDGLELHLNSEILELVFDNTALKQIAEAHKEKSDVTLVVENTTPADTTDKLVFEIHLAVDGEVVERSEFGEGFVTVTIPLASLNLTEKQTVKVWYLERDEDGKEINRTIMEDGFEHDLDNGKVHFKTNHFSEYVVEVVNVETDTSVTVTVDNKTGSITPATIDAPTTGTVGSDYTLTVTCEKACVVLAKDGKGNYTRLPAKAVENRTNTYSFTTTLEEDITFVVAIKGDVNMDGKFSAVDYNMVKSAFFGISLPELNAVVADVNGDKKFSAVDYNMVKAAFFGTALPW